MNLKFPIIFYLDDIFSVGGSDLYKFMKISFPQKNRMVCRERLRNHVRGWIVDSAGQFVELSPAGKEREWARPLGFLWNWVLSDYSVEEARSITIGELKVRMTTVRDNSPEAPLAKDFRSFLKKYRDDEVLSEQILMAWPI